MVTKPRNAAGRFAAAQAEAPKRSAADWLTAVKRGIKQLEAERDQLMARWGASLLDDDESAVERCERQLDALEWKLRRSQKLIDLLPPLVQREQQQQRQVQHPTDEPSARERLLVIEPWIVKWQAVPDNDRSAYFQARLDGLVSERWRLNRLIESFAPRKMTAS